MCLLTFLGYHNRNKCPVKTLNPKATVRQAYNIINMIYFALRAKRMPKHEDETMKLR